MSMKEVSTYKTKIHEACEQACEYIVNKMRDNDVDVLDLQSCNTNKDAVFAMLVDVDCVSPIEKEITAIMRNGGTIMLLCSDASLRTMSDIINSKGWINVHDTFFVQTMYTLCEGLDKIDFTDKDTVGMCCYKFP